MHMLVDPSSLLRECPLTMFDCLGPETHTGEVFCSSWWQTDLPLERPRSSEFSGRWIDGENILTGGFGSVWTRSLLSHSLPLKVAYSESHGFSGEDGLAGMSLPLE